MVKTSANKPSANSKKRSVEEFTPEMKIMTSTSPWILLAALAIKFIIQWLTPIKLLVRSMLLAEPTTAAGIRNNSSRGIKLLSSKLIVIGTCFSPTHYILDLACNNPRSEGQRTHHRAPASGSSLDLPHAVAHHCYGSLCVQRSFQL